MPSVNDIQPTLIGKNATKIELSLQYTFNATDATVIVGGNVWDFYLKATARAEIVIVDLKDNNGTVLKTSAIYIPSDVYMTWQADSVIIDYV